MANNIRGITIEIGGDTTKLGKALDNTEKKSRSLQTELRQIEQSLKFNPGNLELLAQKQEVLTQSVAETTTKLDTLREAERQVIAQFERGEVAEDQVRALQREIIKTENQLESMSNELSDTNKRIQDFSNGTDSAKKHTKEYKESVDDAKKELEDFKDKASEAFDVIGKGTLALGAGATATAGYALTLTNEFDKAFNTLQAQTGATVEEMESLEESVTNIYKANFGESMDDVARAMSTVKTQTKLSGQELENVTKTAILMRDTFDFDVNESIRGVNSLMDQFGITAEEAYNLIAQGAQKGLNQNGDLMDIVNEYAVQFKGAGYNAEEMFNMLVNGADEGTWSIDKLGDAVKEYNIRMTDGSANEYLEKLGLSVEEISSKYAEGGTSAQEATATIIQALKGVENEQDRYIIGQGIMGTMWEDLGENAVYALLDTQGTISKTSDALEKINDIKYDDIGSAVGGLKRTLETDVIEPLDEELKPVVEDVIGYVKKNAPSIKETLSNIIKAVGGFIKTVVENKDAIIGAIVAIGAGLLAWNVVTMIQGLVGAIKSFKLANEGATIAQMALNTVMKANPIGIIITAITALVTAFIYFWNTSEEFREFWINLWETVKNAVGGAIDAVVGFFSSAWTSITEVWSATTEFFGAIGDSIVGFFSSAYDSIVAVWSTISEFFAGIWASIKEVLSPVIEWFTALFTSIYDSLASIVNVIVGLLTGTWEIIKAVFSVVAEWFNTYVISPVANFFSSMWEGIKNLASSAWEGIKSIWTAVSGWFSKNIITPVGNFFSGMWDGLKSGASSAWNGIKSVFSNITTWFRDKFTEAWSAVKGVFSTGGKIFSGIVDGIASVFKTVVNAIITGINKVVAVPFNTINGVLNRIRNIDILGITPFSGLWSKNPLSVPQIPLLYRGGILRKGQVGLLEGNGSEAVVPLEKETGWINRIAQKMNELQDLNAGGSNLALASKMDEVIQTMKTLKSTIVLDTGVLVGETLNKIDEGLGNNYSLRERRI